MRRTLSMLGALALFATPALAARYYVDAGNTQPGNGLSWQTSFNTLGAALAVAGAGDDVWVAAGTYTGSFTIPANVSLFGGFRSGEGLVTNRKPIARQTILDGNGSQRVLTLSNGSVVDGFIVQNGSAGSPGGGGALVNGTTPTIRNCVFSANRNTGGRGSALFVGNGGQPTVENCVFTGNIGAGHVIDIDNAGGTWLHIIVHNNTSNGFHVQNNGNPKVYNSSFTSNSGRGICDVSANNTPVVENCHFDGNAISHFHFRGQELRTIAAVNAISYVTASIDGAPGYLNPSAFDFATSPTSPLIDQGQFMAGFPTTDLVLGARGYDDPRFPGLAGARDIGAVAWQGSRITMSGTPLPGSTVTLSLSAPNDDARTYQVMTALAEGRIPIDTRAIKLAFDGLFLVTVQNQLPAVFANYAGTIASGGSTARINIPNLPALSGLELHTTFVVVNAGSPSGISTIAEPIEFVIN